ncbi:DNA/RNA non-specific endonuclease family protein [Streptococcus mitis]|uniref:DNA/RNA non-specific endonuclease family protein n=1 Tax=Streptococcus mitis TaxID=28037 RepID=A0A081QQS9_STRMT|nr:MULTISPECIES: DNA/RNA non-specific endonuclease [Streptococcus]KEQ45302.1 DNA/RNA non-specific endonuclease family protein [Streptococcus mitis]
MKKFVYVSLSILSAFTLAACSGHKGEAKVSEAKVEQTQAKFDEKLFKEAGLLPFKNEKQLELGELDSKNRATGAHIQLKDSDEPTEKRASKLTYDPVGWHNYKFFYGDGREEAWLMSRGHLIGYQFSGLNDEKRNLVPMTNWLNAGNYSGTDEYNQSSMLYYENRLDSWLDNHPNYYLDYKVTPIYQKDELIPRQLELQYVGVDENGKLLEIKLESSKEKVDKYSVTHVILDNVSANAEINYLDGTAKNLVEDAKVKEEKEKAKKEAEEKAKKEAEEKAEAEKKAKEEEEKARQAEQEKEESQESNTQSANSGGYFKDSRGRWHKPNGKYASKKEIKAAGLQW